MTATGCSADEPRKELPDTPPAENTEEPTAPAGDRKVLIVYFSHTGNTRMLAGYIHDMVESDMVELKTPVRTFLTPKLAWWMSWSLPEPPRMQSIRIFAITERRAVFLYWMTTGMYCQRWFVSWRYAPKQTSSSPRGIRHRKKVSFWRPKPVKWVCGNASSHMLTPVYGR